jgi:uncharacterized repeat protein (TIGR01451 family)
VGPPAPVLAMRAVLPEGVTLNPTPGRADSKAYASNTLFGFRPGYWYSLKLDNLPGFPGKQLYPVLEVRGSIIPRPGMKYMEFAALLAITQEDVQRAFAGAVITKVIYLENPERAIPSSATADRPIEIRSDTERDALLESETSGRIVAILRLGDREPDSEDLERFSIDGTVLLPGEKHLGVPAMPPPLPCVGVPLYDPILGPKADPEECFPNGGDGGNRLGIGPGDRLGGLDTTDVSAEYTAGGKRRVTTSNIVCICSPRFVIRRSEILPAGFSNRSLLGHVQQMTHQNIFLQRERSIASVAREKSLAFGSRLRPGAMLNSEMLHALGTRSRPQAAYRVDGIRAVGAFHEPDELTSIPEGLVLTKSVEPAGPVAQLETLTITLTYTNTGRKPITDLVLSDSLSPRLEYVPGSAAADRPSNVTTIPNEAGSTVVQFELPGPIPPSTKGIVQFKVKVR